MVSGSGQGWFASPLSSKDFVHTDAGFWVYLDVAQQLTDPPATSAIRPVMVLRNGDIDLLPGENIEKSGSKGKATANGHILPRNQTQTSKRQERY